MLRLDRRKRKISWFGVGTILERFPKASVVATPNVVKVMHLNASPEYLAIWNAAFPGQIPKKLVIAEELKANEIDLEETNWLPWNSAIPTRLPRPVCMSLRLGSSLLETLPTTMSICIWSSWIRKRDVSGLPRSTRLSRSTHGQ